MVDLHIINQDKTFDDTVKKEIMKKLIHHRGVKFHVIVSSFATNSNLGTHYCWFIINQLIADKLLVPPLGDADEGIAEVTIKGWLLYG